MTTCLDTGCGVTLVNKDWLLCQLSDQKIKEMSIFLKVRGMGTLKHKSAQVVEVSLFFLGESNKRQKVYSFIRCKLYLVKGLKANILIGSNIYASESFVLNIGLAHALVGSCGVKIAVTARQEDQCLKKRLFPKKDVVISTRSKTMITLLPVSLADDKDF